MVLLSCLLTHTMALSMSSTLADSMPLCPCNAVGVCCRGSVADPSVACRVVGVVAHVTGVTLIRLAWVYEVIDGVRSVDVDPPNTEE